MKDSHIYLRSFIQEVLNASEPECEKFEASRGYYDMDPNDPFSISDVIHGWANCGLKVRESGTYQAVYSADELWAYREYTWSAETASHEDVIGVDQSMYQDKWRFIPDEDENIGIYRWESMVEKMNIGGWDRNRPAYIEIGKNGVAKVGEGNHRLAIAKQLGIDVPVVFSFKNNVTLSHASNVR